MTLATPLLVKKIGYLTFALIVSGALNIGVLSLLLYWMIRETPPTPYSELKPASSEEQQIPFADQRGCVELLTLLSRLSFPQLVNRLSHTQLIENGYAERDLSLACLIAFHHFDFHRALPGRTEAEQKRYLAWKPKGQKSVFTLTVYPELTDQQFDKLIQFAKTERWPLTAEGLFLILKHQQEKKVVDDSLVETFFLTPEFWMAELLFNRSGQGVKKEEILTVLLEGDWTLLKQFVDQQRQLNDSSDARRQKFLLDYLKGGSRSAALLLLKTDWDFSLKKLDDQHVIAILQLMPIDFPKDEQKESLKKNSRELPQLMIFAKEMLASPRSAGVWRQASEWLYSHVGEPMPKQWSHHSALVRFYPEKASLELISKPPVTPVASAAITPAVSLSRAQSVRQRPVQAPSIRASSSVQSSTQVAQAPVKAAQPPSSQAPSVRAAPSQIASDRTSAPASQGASVQTASARNSSVSASRDQTVFKPADQKTTKN